MSDEYASTTRPYLNSHSSGILFLKFVVASVWDDIHNLFSRLDVLEGNRRILEKAFQLAKFGRQWVESQRVNIVFVQDTERYILPGTW